MTGDDATAWLITDGRFTDYDGINVSDVDADGETQYVALGHLEPAAALAAFDRHARDVIGLPRCDAWDETDSRDRNELREKETLSDIQVRWACLEPDPKPGDWTMHVADKDDPAAFPVTTWIG